MPGFYKRIGKRYRVPVRERITNKILSPHQEKMEILLTNMAIARTLYWEQIKDR